MELFLGEGVIVELFLGEGVIVELFLDGTVSEALAEVVIPVLGTAKYWVLGVNLAAHHLQVDLLIQCHAGCHTGGGGGGGGGGKGGISPPNPSSPPRYQTRIKLIVSILLLKLNVSIDRCFFEAPWVAVFPP